MGVGEAMIVKMVTPIAIITHWTHNVEPEVEPPQIAIIGRNGTMCQRIVRDIGRRRVQNVIRKTPGITNPVNLIQRLHYNRHDWAGSHLNQP